MFKLIDMDCRNVSILLDKYGESCKAMADDPAAALAEYIAKAEQRMPKKAARFADRNAIAVSDKRLTNSEAEKIARLIARLPELVEIREGSEQGQDPPQASAAPH